MYKRIIIFLLIFAMWFFGSIFFPFDIGFYSILTLPKIAPNQNLIFYSWIFIYFLNTISIYHLIKNYNLNNNYIFFMSINYLFNQLFSLFFFYMHSMPLTLTSIITVTISSIYLFFETKKINKISSYFFIPYTIWNIYMLILFIIVYIIN